MIPDLHACDAEFIEKYFSPRHDAFALKRQQRNWPHGFRFAFQAASPPAEAPDPARLYDDPSSGSAWEGASRARRTRSGSHGRRSRPVAGYYTLGGTVRIDDLRFALIGTGRTPLAPAERVALGTLAELLPLLA